MRGIGYGWMMVVLAMGCMPAGAGIGGSSGSPVPIGEDMVPDPAYQPKIGDRAVLYAVEDGGVIERYPLLKDVTAYDIFIRCLLDRNAERQFELEQQGWLQWAPAGTRLSVMALQDRTHTGARIIVQVRLVDAEQKNQTFWTASEYITRLVRKEPE